MRFSCCILVVVALAVGGCRGPSGPTGGYFATAPRAEAPPAWGPALDRPLEVAPPESTGSLPISPVRYASAEGPSDGTDRHSGAAIRLARLQADEQLPPPNKADLEVIPSVRHRPVEALDDPTPYTRATPLSLREVTESVYVAFPGLEALRQDLQIAEGKEIASWGEFDLKLKGESFSGPMGYYQNYRNLVKLEQGLFRNGAGVYGQYRIGDGNIQPWYGERETNEGGEFKAGFFLPLLRDRTIDQRRTDIFQATLRRQQVDPIVQAALLEINLAASEAYWSWVAAGLNYDVQQELLRVTIDRNAVYEERVRQMDLAEIELVQNRRLIATRESKVIEALRKLQQSSLKLALFLRDDLGQPLAPPPAALPAGFPTPQPASPEQLSEEVALALQMRPELRELDLQREQALIDLAHGQNQLLPALNTSVDASKDIGGATSSKGDKTPFELEAGLLFDVPLQRRKAAGKVREAQGKLGQIAAKRRLTENKIELQVRDAMSALATSYDRVLRARESLILARQLERAERERFDAGESDLLRVALQEAAAIEAAVIEIEAMTDYFTARAAYQAAVGSDPLTFTE